MKILWNLYVQQNSAIENNEDSATDDAGVFETD
jgi:hypothetical protein